MAIAYLPEPSSTWRVRAWGGARRGWASRASRSTIRPETQGPSGLPISQRLPCRDRGPRGARCASRDPRRDPRQDGHAAVPRRMAVSSPAATSSSPSTASPCARRASTTGSSTSHKPGDIVRVKIYRGHRLLTVKVRVAAYPYSGRLASVNGEALEPHAPSRSSPSGRTEGVSERGAGKVPSPRRPVHHPSAMQENVVALIIELVSAASWRPSAERRISCAGRWRAAESETAPPRPRGAPPGGSRGRGAAGRPCR